MTSRASRRSLLGGVAAGAAALALSCASEHRAAPATSVFDELDARINAGMKAYGIPGLAVAVWAGGQEYIKGYGVTNVDHPVPVDGDTVFPDRFHHKNFHRYHDHVTGGSGQGRPRRAGARVST